MTTRPIVVFPPSSSEPDGAMDGLTRALAAIIVEILMDEQDRERLQSSKQPEGAPS